VTLPVAAPASRRFQIGSIFAAFAAASVYWGSYIASLPYLQAITGLTDARFGLLLPSGTVGGLISMQLLGRVLHRVQAYAIPVAFTGFAAGMLVLAAASGPASLAAALFLAGAASGALDISLNMRLARIETDFDLRLFNRAHAVFPMGMLVTSASVGLLRDAGATPAMIFPAGAAILLAAAATEWRAGRHQAPLPAPPRRGQGRVRLGGVLVALGSLAALGAIMESGAHTWSALFVEGHLGSSPATGGFAAAAILSFRSRSRSVGSRTVEVPSGTAITISVAASISASIATAITATVAASVTIAVTASVSAAISISTASISHGPGW
jgi:hypothetical protein